MKCKNCNVTLSNYLDKCPLCGEKIDNVDNNKVYNNSIEEFSLKINLMYFSKTIIKLLILSNIICMICNIVINKSLTWSIYVLFSSIYLSSFSLYIILNNKKISFILNMISLELLLFIIAYLTKSLSWFIYYVGPYILIFTLFILLNDYLSKHKNIPRNMSCLLMFIAMSLYIIDGCIKLHHTKEIMFSWSLISNIPILIISIILMIISFNKRIVDQIEKRFFI